MQTRRSAERNEIGLPQGTEETAEESTREKGTVGNTLRPGKNTTQLLFEDMSGKMSGNWDMKSSSTQLERASKTVTGVQETVDETTLMAEIDELLGEEATTTTNEDKRTNKDLSQSDLGKTDRKIKQEMIESGIKHTEAIGHNKQVHGQKIQTS